MKDTVNYLEDREYKNVVLARNGEYVGLFRYDTKSNTMKIWRHVINKPYGRHTIASKQNFSDDDDSGIDRFWCCNEMYLIPSNYNLNKREHLLLLNNCLGYGRWETWKRIQNCKRNTKGVKSNERKIYEKFN